MNLATKTLLSTLLLCSTTLINAQIGSNKGWVADNGNGTYTNPLFFEDTPDPCMIRVGEDYYLTCSSMHLMPGLPIMHSKDLVNWELINYAFPSINPGKEYSFTDGKDAYGNGIWAPSFVYNKGVYYIFANINNHGTQVFKTRDPYGKWEHYEMKRGFHDLSVFFDDDEKVYVCWGHKDVELAQLNEDLTDIIPGTHKVITNEGAEGSHMYKINGKYYIIWSVQGANTPMLAGVADDPYGPYRVEKICDENHTGVHALPGLKESPRERNGKKFDFWGYDPNGFVSMHQGGIIDTPDGEWWGYVMQDHTSLGRNTCLSPITWHNDIPYFGLPGNLAQTPKVWIKPNLPEQPIRTLVERSDDFSSSKLGMQWQFNHLPDNSKWALEDGELKFNTMYAPSFWNARNSLTQRIVGLESEISVKMDITGMQTGDVAGLAHLIYPYGWIGVEKTGKATWLKMINQMTYPVVAAVDSIKLSSKISSVLLKSYIDIDNGKASFAYSIDNGKTFKNFGNTVTLHFQLYTFQGSRITLFAYNNQNENGGGYAKFDNFIVEEKYPNGFRNPIPYGKEISFKSCKTGEKLSLEGQSNWMVEYLPLGRVALKTGGKYLSIQTGNNFKARLVEREPTNEETFQWMELEGGNLVLMSLASNRYVSFQDNGEIYAKTISPSPNRKNDNTRFELE